MFFFLGGGLAESGHVAEAATDMVRGGAGVGENPASTLTTSPGTTAFPRGTRRAPNTLTWILPSRRSGRCMC